MSDICDGRGAVGTSDIQHWSYDLHGFAYGGVVRAVESLGKDDSALVISIDCATLIQNWEQGYDGCWVAGTYIAGL
jgi:hypothetical protein